MRKIKWLMAMVIVLSMLCINVFGESPTRIKINGTDLKLTVQPVIVNGRTLVPLRAIFEALNVVPVWDNETKMVTAKTGTVDMLLKIGSRTATINNKIVNLDVPGTLVNGSTMVPARFIAETFGGEVDWDEASKTVLIRTSDNKLPIGANIPASTTAAQPTTVNANAYGYMKKFIERYEGAKFNSKIKLGELSTYRAELSEVKISVVENDTAMGKYDPDTDTITLSIDPTKSLSAAQSSELEQLVWHEVGHKIENTHGDMVGGDQSALHAERNVEYMKRVSMSLSKLVFLEKLTDEERIREAWVKFEKEYDDALTLDETKAYPPDLKLMSEWFGFSVDKKKILDFYKSGQAGELLKNALSKPAMIWTGTWNTNFGVMKIIQNGANCSGSYAYQGGRIVGTVSGNTFTGTWVESDDQGTFSFTMSPDTKSYSGSWKETSPNPSQGGNWSGTR